MSRLIAMVAAAAATFGTHTCVLAAASTRPVKEASTAYVLKPGIGEIARAEVGESLYSEAARTLTREYEGTIATAVAAKLQGYELNVVANSVRPMVYKPSDRRPMMCFPVTQTVMRAIFGAKRYYGCLVDTQGNKTFDKATFEHQGGDYPLETPVPYSLRTIETTSTEQDSFQIDVLYQGMSKGEVKISYRESLNGTARPAFTQDVAYELAPDGTALIGFKGMRLKVLKATGQYIEYVIEQTIPSFTKTRAELQEQSNPKDVTKPWYQ